MFLDWVNPGNSVVDFETIHVFAGTNNDFDHANTVKVGETDGSQFDGLKAQNWRWRWFRVFGRKHSILLGQSDQVQGNIQRGSVGYSSGDDSRGRYNDRGNGCRLGQRGRSAGRYHSQW